MTNCPDGAGRAPINARRYNERALTSVDPDRQRNTSGRTAFAAQFAIGALHFNLRVAVVAEENTYTGVCQDIIVGRG